MIRQKISPPDVLWHRARATIIVAVGAGIGRAPFSTRVVGRIEQDGRRVTTGRPGRSAGGSREMS
ncbi:hypothetical protein SJA_P1-02100 (plasmid) [Sphingobium indicum UT26S]|uniref:Uncharacterized protein n=1 Tax=Sphingobium indicum (strain DSM 16413 / CCM 7287 / MTCC 6362 / UT26 / NBRC 101211 / UT26S) TaxID=452662 RepID=D4Z980_SPHIU|nr:hypothetical protein SJA_P1-02100 [Sphingobium indicum UT26S]